MNSYFDSYFRSKLTSIPDASASIFSILHIPNGLLKVFYFFVFNLVIATSPTLAQAKNTMENDDFSNIALSFDNDILTPGKRDQDYTAGLAITLHSHNSNGRYANKLHMQLDEIFLPKLKKKCVNRSVEIGAFGFTPEKIESTNIIKGDRPYSSLVYLSTSSEYVDLLSNEAWTSSLSLGALGLNIMPSVQNKVHSLTGSDPANGWQNQISQGGEPTAKFSLNKHQLKANYEDIEIKESYGFSVGYITELNYSLGFRSGKIRSPWWSLKPELVSYGEHANANSQFPKIEESYFWGGFALRARAYNAFLQGQFRSSQHEYNSKELNHLIFESWLGYSAALKNGYKFSYVLRGHTSELKTGIGDRNVIWGGLIISKPLG